MDHVKNNSKVKTNSKDISKYKLIESKPTEEQEFEFINQYFEVAVQGDHKRLRELESKAMVNGFSGAEVDAIVEKLKPSIEARKKELLEESDVVFLKDNKVTGPRWAVPNWFQMGCLSLIGGEKGRGKSTFVINLIVRNSLKHCLWNKGKDGDGRKSMYICLETSPNDARDKVIACGGSVKNIHIVTHVGKERIDLQNPIHFRKIIELIQDNKYFAVVIDPIVELVLDAQNNNKLIRQQLNIILDWIKDTDTILIGTAHLRKEKTTVSQTGAFRGASELVNMARSLFRIYDKEDGDGKVLVRFDVNNSQYSNVGGLDFKIESRSQKNYKGDMIETGYIHTITYNNEPQASILKNCKTDDTKIDKIDYDDIIKQIILEMEAKSEELNTKVIKNIAKARGVTTYHIKHKLDWKEMGYYEDRVGFGGNFKVILKKEIV